MDRERHQFHVNALLLMGGAGSRFDSPLPKQFHRLAGKQVYRYALEQLLKIPQFKKIILVCHCAFLQTVERDISIYHDPRIQLIAGGATRQESSFLGLLACDDATSHVVIHDAVRPFVTQDILLANIDGAVTWGAVDTCIPSTDTVVHTSAHTIQHIPDRTAYWRGQTPQSFSYSLIVNAHRQAQKLHIHNLSDDCSLALLNNHPVQLVLGSEENMKITTELDLILAEQILHQQNVRSSTADSTMCLLGKRYAITGGTGGIGQAIAQALKQVGAIPLCISRSSLEFPADLTNYEATDNLFKTIEQLYGPLDGLINGLGRLKVSEVAALTQEDIKELIETNFSSVVYSCKCAKLKTGAHIINIASSAYLRGRKDFAIYAGAKAAVVNFSQALAEERTEISVNTLIPQRTNTSMRHEHFPDEDKNSLLDPQEIAQAVLSLLSKQGMTGTVVEVRKNYSNITTCS